MGFRQEASAPPCVRREHWSDRAAVAGRRWPTSGRCELLVPGRAGASCASAVTCRFGPEFRPEPSWRAMPGALLRERVGGGLDERPSPSPRHGFRGRALRRCGDVFQRYPCKAVKNFRSGLRFSLGRLGIRCGPMACRRIRRLLGRATAGGRYRQRA